MMFRQLASEEISKPCTHKGTEHLDRPAAEQESKSTACESGRKSKCHRRIQPMDPLYIIQQAMQFFPRHILSVYLKFPDKMLQTVKLGRIHTRIGKTE